MITDPQQLRDEMARVTRRQFLGHTSMGLGIAAMGSLAGGSLFSSPALGTPAGYEVAPAPMIPGLPSMGAWVTYRLGSANENLPSFVVLTSKSTQGVQPIANRQWSAGFLPGRCQGVEFQGKGDPVHYVGNPGGTDRTEQEHVMN